MDSHDTDNATDQFLFSQPLSNDTDNTPDQFSNQFTQMNLQFQPNPSFNLMNAPYHSLVQPHFGPGFTFQGLMSAPQLPFASQPSNSSKGSRIKVNGSKKNQTSQTNVIRRWTNEEDIALTKAWLYVSVDADVGTNQKTEAMWIRIHKAWKDNMGEYDESRTYYALECRWGTIKAAVSKFHAQLERLERHPRSGTTSEDMKREALRMYRELNDGQPFKFEHCWEILKTNPKWCSQQLTQTGGSMKRKSINGDNNDILPPSPPPGSSSLHEVVDNVANETAHSDGIVRPLGRKGTKEKKKRINEDKGVTDVLNHLHCTLESHLTISREELELKKERDMKEYELREKTMKWEMQFKERNQKLKEKAQKRKEQKRILNQDVAKLPPALREAFEKIQIQILKEWEDDGIFGEANVISDLAI